MEIVQFITNSYEFHLFRIEANLENDFPISLRSQKERQERSVFANVCSMKHTSNNY